MYDRAIANGPCVAFSQTPGSSGAVMTQQYVSNKLDCLIDKALNEVYLFHGTKRAKVVVLLQNGFDQRLANMKIKGLKLGLGIYAADEANLSHQYVGKIMIK